MKVASCQLQKKEILGSWQQVGSAVDIISLYPICAITGAGEEGVNYSCGLSTSCPATEDFLRLGDETKKFGASG